MEIPQNKLKDIVCVIKFIIILDNYGKRIYSKYYTKEYELDDDNKQLEFEKKLSQYALDNNVANNEIDVFNYLTFNIISNISPEVIIFIGGGEDDNELLLNEFYNNFESILFNLIQDSLTRKSIYKVYDKLGNSGTCKVTISTSSCDCTKKLYPTTYTAGHCYSNKSGIDWIGNSTVVNGSCKSLPSGSNSNYGCCYYSSCQTCYN